MCTRRREDERDREGEREGLSERERREDSSQLRPTWSGLPSPQANEPPVARLPTSQPPAEWERLWKGSDWLCTEVGGDWSAFLYAQGVSWLLVNAMGATNWGVGSEMKLHMPSWRASGPHAGPPPPRLDAAAEASRLPLAGARCMEKPSCGGSRPYPASTRTSGSTTTTTGSRTSPPSRSPPTRRMA